MTTGTRSRGTSLASGADALTEKRQDDDMVSIVAPDPITLDNNNTNTMDKSQSHWTSMVECYETPETKLSPEIVTSVVGSGKMFREGNLPENRLEGKTGQLRNLCSYSPDY